MPYTENFAEYAAPLAVIYPASYNSEQNTAFVNMGKYHRLAIVIIAGAVGTDFDADVEVATDDAATGLFTLKTITANTEDNEIVVIDVRADELGKPSGADGENYDWVRLELTPSGSCLLSAVIFGIEPRYAPIDQTLWDEVVS